MQTEDYLKILAEDIHSATIATIAGDGHPQKCINISVKPVIIDQNRCLPAASVRKFVPNRL